MPASAGGLPAICAAASRVAGFSAIELTTAAAMNTRWRGVTDGPDAADDLLATDAGAAPPFHARSLRSRLRTESSPPRGTPGDLRCRCACGRGRRGVPAAPEA